LLGESVSLIEVHVVDEHAFLDDVECVELLDSFFHQGTQHEQAATRKFLHSSLLLLKHLEGTGPQHSLYHRGGSIWEVEDADLGLEKILFLLPELQIEDNFLDI
jgi:hypothetical protein